MECAGKAAHWRGDPESGSFVELIVDREIGDMVLNIGVVKRRCEEGCERLLGA